MPLEDEDQEGDDREGDDDDDGDEDDDDNEDEVNTVADTVAWSSGSEWFSTTSRNASSAALYESPSVCDLGTGEYLR